MAVLFCGAKQTVKNCEKPITKGFEKVGGGNCRLILKSIKNGIKKTVFFVS